MYLTHLTMMLFLTLTVDFVAVSQNKPRVHTEHVTYRHYRVQPGASLRLLSTVLSADAVSGTSAWASFFCLVDFHLILSSVEAFFCL